MGDIRIGALNDVRTGWGESARWDDALQRLYFVDCVASAFAWCDAAAREKINRVATPSLPTALSRR